MPAFGFRRESPESEHAEASRSLEAQGVAIAGVCALHHLELVAVYTERHADFDGNGHVAANGQIDGGAHQWHALLRDARTAADTPRGAGAEPYTIVIPSLRILGERTFDRLL